MARPTKKGLDYFSLDVDLFTDPKIKIVKARYGTDGLALYIYLLCEIYRNGYYVQLNEDYIYIISEDLHMSPDKVKQVINFLLVRSLFDNKLYQSDKVLTSAGIQRRFQEAIKSRASKNPIIVEGYWLLKKEETQPFIKVQPFLGNSENNVSYSEKNLSNSENNDIKESKVNNIYTYFSDKDLNLAFNRFITMLKTSNSYVTEDSIELLVDKVKRFDIPTAIEMLNRSTIHGWKDIYPVVEKKQNTKQHNKSTCNNKFNSFPQRNYSNKELSTMEQQLLSRG